MTILLDANVLIALLVTDHTHHEDAESWLVDTTHNFATCPVTEGSLMRLLIREGQTAETVKAVVTAVSADPRHEFWEDDAAFADVPMTGVVGHRQVTDAYLAQLARRRGAWLATFDRGLAELHSDVSELLPATQQ